MYAESPNQTVNTSIQSRNSHHSLDSKSNPLNHQFKRKVSNGSISIAEIDQLIMDIKISPGKSASYDTPIQQIYKALIALKQMKDHQYIIKQIQTINLLTQSIQKKLEHSTKVLPREIQGSAKKNNDVSPIKMLNDQNPNTSRIFYTNFSIKQLENNENNAEINCHRRVASNLDKSQRSPLSNNTNYLHNAKEQSTLQTPAKNKIVQTLKSSQRNKVQDDQSKIYQLNNQIKMLQDLLKQKMKVQPTKNIKPSFVALGGSCNKKQKQNQALNYIRKIN